ncbi:MAG TPA: hypothetical protein VH643_41500 [Gemmataceae bacterium]|jgi:hypothetical protein
MQVQKSNQSNILLNLTHNELILLNNALNEVCHGLDIPEFSTRLGASWDELEALRREINAALEGMTKPKDEG